MILKDINIPVIFLEIKSKLTLRKRHMEMCYTCHLEHFQPEFKFGDIKNREKTYHMYTWYNMINKGHDT